MESVKENDGIAVLYITIAAASFGTFGLMSAIAGDINADPLFISTAGFVLSTAFFWLVVVTRGKKSGQACSTKESIKMLFSTNFGLAIIRIITGTNHFFLLCGFILLHNKIIGTLLLEIYPLLAVLISKYSIFKLDNSSGSQSNKYLYWLLVLVSAIGVYFILVPSKATLFSEINQGGEYIDSVKEYVLPVILIFIGAIFSAITTVADPKITKSMYEKFGGKYDKLQIVFINKYITNLFTTAIYILSFVIFFNPNDIANVTNLYFIIFVFVFAVFMDIIPGICGRLAGIYTRNSSVFLAWLLAPIVSILLLYITGYGYITAHIALGIVFILVPNLLLNIDNNKSASYKLTIISVLVISTIIFLDIKLPIASSLNEESYFNIISTSTIFFALLMGFLTTRLIDRQFREESMIQEIVSKLELFYEHSKHCSLYAKKAVANIFRIYTAKTTKQIRENYYYLIENKIEGLDYERLNKLVLSNQKGAKTGEVYVLIMLASLAIGVAILYRPSGFVFDSFALVLCSAVIFTMGIVWDITAERDQKFLERAKKDSATIYSVKLDPEEEGNHGKRIISSMFLIIIMISIISVFWLKSAT